MARSPERSLRAHADPDHVGRHRRARLTNVDRDIGRDEPAAQAYGLDDGDGDQSFQDVEELEQDLEGWGADEEGWGSDEEGRGQDAGVRETGAAAATVVPLFSVPDSLRSVDVAVGGRAVRGLLLVAVVLLLTLGGRWWWVQQQAAGVPVEQVLDVGGMEADGVATSEAAAPSAPPTSSGASDAEDPAVQSVLVVHVIGEVHEPGVVQLPVGSRVIDAVRAAGGITDEADPASLNLARPVVDGEQVWVGAPGEEPPPGLVTGPVGAGTGGAAGSPGDRTGSAGGQDGPGLVVDLNLAGPAELEELPGVGPVTAGNILAWREQHGRFTVVEELMEVSGIGEKTFEQLRPHVTVGG